MSSLSQLFEIDLMNAITSSSYVILAISFFKVSTVMIFDSISATIGIKVSIDLSDYQDTILSHGRLYDIMTPIKILIIILAINMQIMN